MHPDELWALLTDERKQELIATYNLKLTDDGLLWDKQQFEKIPQFEWHKALTHIWNKNYAEENTKTPAVDKKPDSGEKQTTKTNSTPTSTERGTGATDLEGSTNKSRTIAEDTRAKATSVSK